MTSYLRRTTQLSPPVRIGIFIGWLAALIDLAIYYPVAFGPVVAVVWVASIFYIAHKMHGPRHINAHPSRLHGFTLFGYIKWRIVGSPWIARWVIILTTLPGSFALIDLLIRWS